MTTNHVMVDPVNVVSFVDPSRSATPVAAGSFSSNEAAAFSSLANIEAALLDHGDTQAYLNTLTLNDKVFRLREFIRTGEIDLNTE